MTFWLVCFFSWKISRKCSRYFSVTKCCSQLLPRFLFFSSILLRWCPSSKFHLVHPIDFSFLCLLNVTTNNHERIGWGILDVLGLWYKPMKNRGTHRRLQLNQASFGTVLFCKLLPMRPWCAVAHKGLRWWGCLPKLLMAHTLATLGTFLQVHGKIPSFRHDDVSFYIVPKELFYHWLSNHKELLSSFSVGAPFR